MKKLILLLLSAVLLLGLTACGGEGDRQAPEGRIRRSVNPLRTTGMSRSLPPHQTHQTHQTHQRAKGRNRYCRRKAPPAVRIQTKRIPVGMRPSMSAIRM